MPGKVLVMYERETDMAKLNLREIGIYYETVSCDVVIQWL